MDKMKVLYDYQAFEYQDFGGVSKCFCKLIANLPKDVEAKIVIRQSNNVHLKESDLVKGIEPFAFNERVWRARIPFKHTHQIYVLLTRLGILRGAEYYNHRLAIEFLKRKDFDVFHPTYFDPYFLKYIGEKPWVCTIHDMMPELYPQYFGTNNEQTIFKQKYLKYASAIVAVSQTTKDDLVRIMGVPADKITVIHHGGPKMEKITARPLIGYPYFLYVGTRGVYKNFKQTAVDFSEFYKNHKDVKLVCTGGPFTKDENTLLANLDIQDVVVHYKASDQQLKNLYAHAIAFIYPSLYEGFGMPILEAYAYGCPVMLNDIKIFREVAGDAAVFFKSDGNASNLEKYLEKMCNMTETQRHELISNGYSQLSKYSWRKSAAKLANLYTTLL